MQSIRNKPSPQNLFTEELASLKGLQKTKTSPHIYWCPKMEDTDSFTTRSPKEWRNIIATTTTPTTDSGKQPTVRFKTIPEFEIQAGDGTDKKNLQAQETVSRSASEILSQEKESAQETACRSHPRNPELKRKKKKE